MDVLNGYLATPRGRALGGADIQQGRWLSRRMGHRPAFIRCLSQTLGGGDGEDDYADHVG